MRSDSRVDKDTAAGGMRCVRTVSSSVVAGEPIQQKPTVLRAVLSISPSIAGKLELEGK